MKNGFMAIGLLLAVVIGAFGGYEIQTGLTGLLNPKPTRRKNA